MSRRSVSIWFLVLAAAHVVVATSNDAPAQSWNGGNRDIGNRGDDDYRHNERRWNDQRGNGTDQDGQPTERQKQACRPDVFRLCGRYIPDRNAIAACLHQKIDQLNPDCRAVMEGRLR